MAKFILVNSRLVNTSHIAEITFLDSYKKIIFTMEDENRTYHKVYDDEEHYEVACSNLKSHLETIYID